MRSCIPKLVKVRVPSIVTALFLAILLAGCSTSVVPPQAPLAEEAAEDVAISTSALVTYDCGGEGEAPCGMATTFFWENGNGFCDRGLVVTSNDLKGIPFLFDGDQFITASVIEGLNNLRSISAQWGPVISYFSTLDFWDFFSQVCTDLGCSPPYPDPTDHGWSDTLPKVAEAIALAGRSIAALAPIPESLVSTILPGTVDTLNSLDDEELDSVDDLFTLGWSFVTSFAGDIVSIGDAFANLGKYFDPPGQCINDTRRQQAATDFQNTWTYWAMQRQTDLARFEPINLVAQLAGHNAFNNTADNYPFPNQQVSMTDQLRAGTRVIMLDTHFAPDLPESIVTGTTVALCHGKDTHLGCSISDRMFSSGIKEIGAWLKAPENGHAVIIIEIEDYVEENLEGVLAPIRKYLDAGGAADADLVLRTSEKPANRWPTIAEMLSMNRRVLILGPSDGYGSPFVFDGTWGGAYKHGFGSSYADNFDPTTCTGEDTVLYGSPDAHFVKFAEVFEDRVEFLGPGLPNPLSGQVGLLDREGLSDLVNCNIAIIGLDQILGVHDEPDRLQGLVWSWRGNDRGQYGDAALMQTDGRWMSADATQEHPFACTRPRAESSSLVGGILHRIDPLDYGLHPEEQEQDLVGSDWQITTAAGPWSEGGVTCIEEFGTEYVFSVPTGGYQNQRLMAANTSGLAVWLNHDDIDAEGMWVVNRHPVAVAGSDQTVDEGSEIVFDASASVDPEGGTLSYTWAFGDGVTSNDATPTHVYADDSGTQPDGVFVAHATPVDPKGGADREGVNITVNNVIPTITGIVNSSPGSGGATKGETITVDVTFSDPGTLDTHSALVDWGDGTTSSCSYQNDAVDCIVTEAPFGPPGSTNGLNGSVRATHVYQDGGIFTITVTIADDDEPDNGDTAVTYSVITGVGVSGGVLQVVGTDESDRVSVNRRGTGEIQVHADFLPTGNFKTFPLEDVDEILVALFGGDDHLSIAGDVELTALVFAGAGDDKIISGRGNDILLGGQGHDDLQAGNGHDIMIGGDGRDALLGQSDSDLLLGEASVFDAIDVSNPGSPRLKALLAEWSSGRPLSQRVANLQGPGSADRLNGDTYLDATTVTSDGLVDRLNGGPGENWLLPQ